MTQRWMKATDTFVGILPDGSQRLVAKGEPFPESHELVRRDLEQDEPGRARLFVPLDPGEADLAPPKSAPQAQAPEPVKAAAKAAGRAAGKASLDGAADREPGLLGGGRRG